MAYARVQNGQMPNWRRYRRIGMSGLGDCYDTESGVSIDCNSGAPLPVSGSVAIPLPVSPGGSNPDWSQFWQGLTASSLNLLGKVVVPPAYQQTTRDAYGNVISTTVAQGASGAPGTVAALGGSISPNVLLIGGGAAALLILVMAMKR